LLTNACTLKSASCAIFSPAWTRRWRRWWATENTTQRERQLCGIAWGFRWLGSSSETSETREQRTDHTSLVDRYEKKKRKCCLGFFSFSLKFLLDLIRHLFGQQHTFRRTISPTHPHPPTHTHTHTHTYVELYRNYTTCYRVGFSSALLLYTVVLVAAELSRNHQSLDCGLQHLVTSKILW
jgi:hypothetical protein